MFRFFGGKILLSWKDPESHYKAYFDQFPLWKKFLHTWGWQILVIWALFFTFFQVDFFIDLFLDTPSAISWIEHLGLNLLLSGISGIVIGLVIGTLAYFSSTKFVLKEKVAIKNNPLGSPESWKYEELDGYAYIELGDENGIGLGIFNLALIKDSQVLVLMELPETIGSNELANVLEGRLKCLS